jgi:hypothetical protein
LNKQKRLLKKFNKRKDPETKARIKVHDKEIKQYYYQKKKSLVRSKIIPNNSKSLWDAVKLAKNLNIQNLPDKPSLDDAWVDLGQLLDVFADHFKSKVDNIKHETELNETIYNGKQKIRPEKLNLTSNNNFKECVNSLKKM